MKTILKLIKELDFVKRLFLSGLLLIALASGGRQVAPIILQKAIDGPLTDLVKGEKEAGTSFLYLLLGYLVLIFLMILLSYIATRILSHCANRVTENLRNKAYQIMQELPVAYFDDKPAGKVGTTIVNDTETLRQQFYSQLLTNVFVNVLQLIFIYVIVFSLNVYLGIVLLLLLPILWLWQHVYQKLSETTLKEYYEGRSHLNSIVNESINGIDILQLYHQEETLDKDFKKTTSQMLKHWYKLIFLDSTINWSLAEFLKYMMIALILIVTGYQFLGDSTSVSPGQLFIYISYMMTLFDIISMLVRQFTTVQHALSTGERVLSFLSEETESDAKAQLQVINARVSFEHVNFSYEKGKPVLKDISIRADKGETIALVGHTGSGKSSIMNLLYRFYDADSGEIRIDDQDIREFSRESVRKNMGIVLQDPFLFTGTIASNVSMGNPKYSDAMIIEALNAVGADKMLERLPKGINEEVTEKGSRFSSGERQLIAFARTLIANPKLLILDEATSHIDTETEEVIQKAMEVLKSGRTTFIIAHRLSTIQTANQILVLDAGRIVEKGNHDSLMQLNGKYAQMYRMQIKE